MPLKPLKDMSPVEMLEELEEHRKEQEFFTTLIFQNYNMRSFLASMGVTPYFAHEVPMEIVFKYFPELNPANQVGNILEGEPDGSV